MPVEIEAKIKVESFNPVLEKLKEHAATRVGDFLEINAIFDTEDRSLLAADKGLRVRMSRAADGAEHCTMTYKGPRRHSAMKSREETEMTVSDFDAAVKMLEALRFIQVVTFEKRRQSWELAGCKIELDELPHLGPFVEIEGQSEKSIQKVQDMLGLGSKPIVKTAYVGLMMTWLADHGSNERRVGF